MRTDNSRGLFRSAATLTAMLSVCLLASAPAAAKDLRTLGEPFVKPVKIYRVGEHLLVQFKCPRLDIDLKPYEDGYNDALERAGFPTWGVDMYVTATQPMKLPRGPRWYFPMADLFDPIMNSSGGLGAGPRQTPLFDCAEFDAAVWLQHYDGRGIIGFPKPGSHGPKLWGMSDENSRVPYEARPAIFARWQRYYRTTRRFRVVTIAESERTKRVSGVRETILPVSKTPPVDCRANLHGWAEKGGRENLGAIMFSGFPQQRSLDRCVVAFEPDFMLDGAILLNYLTDDTATIRWLVNGKVEQTDGPVPLAFGSGSPYEAQAAPIQQLRFVTPPLPIGKTSKVEMIATSSNGTDAHSTITVRPRYLKKAPPGV